MREREEADYVAFVRQHRRDLLRIAYLVCGDWAGAEDVTQTALEKLYLAWSRRRSDPLPYARRIVFNAGIDQHRSPWRRREVPGGDRLRDVVVPAAQDRVADHLTLAAAVTALPAGQRRVVVAVYYADLSIPQAADLLRLSEGTVKSYLHRARARLEELLEPSARPLAAGPLVARRSGGADVTE